ncbi:hypothetical protein EMPS_07346 [Entomortierella parvispora]|uniref:Uncharacterized protein n=1 Tax=Entomortierella parvispora TaxID=205924 RepID=A0A9P3HES2_9FUNG|nr:hypothetical protein EMPS_07346 [Entomortierella parvispora]
MYWFFRQQIQACGPLSVPPTLDIYQRNRLCYLWLTYLMSRVVYPEVIEFYCALENYIQGTDPYPRLPLRTAEDRSQDLETLNRLWRDAIGERRLSTQIMTASVSVVSYVMFMSLGDAEFSEIFRDAFTAVAEGTANADTNAEVKYLRTRALLGLDLI